MDLKVVFSCLIVSMVLFFSSCNKEYYESNDIQFSVVVPDTIYLDSTVVIKGTIDKPLDIRVYFQDYEGAETLVGILKPYSDSISWKPTNIPEGPAAFTMAINYKIKRNHGGVVSTFQSVTVKKRIH